MEKKINSFILVIFLVFSVVSYPGIGNGGSPDSTITANGSTSLGVFDNMAGGINFWGQKEAQQMFMEEVGSDLYRLKIRLHEVQKEGDSYTNFPFLEEDFVQRLNMARDMGCRIMVQIYGIPRWLSTSEDERIFSNNLPNYAKYPPMDFAEWAELVSAAVRRLKDIGLEGIDYYELFGEPNAGSTWYQQTMNGEPNELYHTTAQVMQNFYEVYKYTALGIQDADPNAKIGGPAIIPNVSGIWWTRFLCREIESRNVPLDFYSWHWYRIDDGLEEFLNRINPYSPLTVERVRTFFGPRYEKEGFNPDQIASMVSDIYYYLKMLEEEGYGAIRYPYSFCSSQLKRILSEEGFDQAEIFLTEWNVDYLYNRKHDNHYSASFIARALIDLTDSYTEAQTFYSLSPIEPVTGYTGDFSLFVNGSTPKPSFNAFKAFAMLGNGIERVDAISSDNEIYCIATKDQDSISLLATYYVKDDPPSFSLGKEVMIEIKDIPFPMYNYEVYLIDRNHSNDFFGFGPELELVGQGIGGNDFEKRGNLKVYGVVLVKINRIQ